MKRAVLLSLVLAACTHVGDPSTPEPAPAPSPTPAFAPKPPKTAPKATTRIELTAVTLADDCGPTAKKLENATPGPKAKARSAVAPRRCEQTSMQLAIVAEDAASLRVKSVELLDDTGRSLGTLTPREPTKWSDATGVYEAWDEAFTAGATINVKYTLSQPPWSTIPDRWNKTFTLKTVLTVGGVDQTAQKDVTVAAPVTLPPNVKT